MSEQIIATRTARLEASLIDTLLMMLVVMPIAYLTGGFDGASTGVRPSGMYSFALGILAVVTFFAINGKLLLETGQTIGKKVMGIKIVSMNGDRPTLKEHLGKRYAAYFLSGLVPLLGGLLSIVDILAIFGKSKRCIHDHIAGTKVVKC